MARIIWISCTVLLAILNTNLSMAQQVELERQVIGSSASDALYFNTLISGNVGEVAVQTGNGNGIKVTEGFEQPFFPGPLRVIVQATPASCRSYSDGKFSIKHIYGCEAPYHVQWENGDSSLTLTGLDTGTYHLVVRTSSCEKTFDLHMAELDRPCPLTFYNSITPNGDGVNDQWNIKDIILPYYRNNKVSIFNQWGQKVWERTGYNNGDVVWKGNNSKRVKLAPGTYFYKATAGGDHYSGYVEIIR